MEPGHRLALYRHQRALASILTNNITPRTIFKRSAEQSKRTASPLELLFGSDRFNANSRIQVKSFYSLISLSALALGCLAVQYGQFCTDDFGQDQKLVTAITTAGRAKRGTSNVLMGGFCYITAAHNVWDALPANIQVYDTFKDPANGRWRVDDTRHRAPGRVLIHPLFNGSIDSPHDVALLGFDVPWKSAGTRPVSKLFKAREYLKFRGWGLNETQGLPTFLSQGSALVSTHQDSQCSWEGLLNICMRAAYHSKRHLACSGDSGACVYSATNQCKGIIITSHGSPNARCGNYTSNGVVDFANLNIKRWFANVLLDCILDGAFSDNYSNWSHS